ncbi:MAG: isoprenyl transferase [Alphaproteobacteria bacterium]|nr:isoprenyl transferase [Alphaproteobacteria bacterium]
MTLNLDLLKIPKHVAIIMDGNGRWAKKQGLDRIHGHLHGVKVVKDIVKISNELQVNYLTLYAFSVENWNRPKEEVDALMELLAETIANETQELHQNNVRLRVIGNLTELTPKASQLFSEAMTLTQNNTSLNLIMALNYSSHSEINTALKKMFHYLQSNQLDSKDITPTLFQQFLDTADIPNPDLLIRTGGEFRVSNFLLYQIAYSELYFTQTLWPDFNAQSFINAIEDYQKRQRRFGMTSEQIANTNIYT